MSAQPPHEPPPPLLAPLDTLPAAQAKAPRLAEAVGGSRLIDLLFHLPERYVDRRRVTSLAEAVTACLEAARSRGTVTGEPAEAPAPG